MYHGLYLSLSNWLCICLTFKHNGCKKKVITNCKSPLIPGYFLIHGFEIFSKHINGNLIFFGNHSLWFGLQRKPWKLVPHEHMYFHSTIYVYSTNVCYVIESLCPSIILSKNFGSNYLDSQLTYWFQIWFIDGALNSGDFYFCLKSTWKISVSSVILCFLIK